MGYTAADTAAFDRYYRDIYTDRWEALRVALAAPGTPVAFSSGLTQPYYLDEASLVAATALQVVPGESVLDMCAAPGGKTLVLATALGGTGLLVSNDRSSQRRVRLRSVIENHLDQAHQSIIRITSHDASKWGLYEQQAYDAVLLDAPCSSERHVLASDKAMKEWSPSKTKHVAVQQFAMLAAALEAVRIGGRILYSTCSISPMENERVIGKLFERRGGRVEQIPYSAGGSEQLEYGSIMLPDRAGGRGPLFFCLLRRTA
jgi:16S rRNA C967 or C1407 C5-methylase (RsmB/RsmF family)